MKHTMINIPTNDGERYVLSFTDYGDDFPRSGITVHGEDGCFAFGVNEVSAAATKDVIRSAFVDREPVDTPGFTGAYDGEEFAGVLRIDGQHYGEWGLEDFDVEFRIGADDLAVLREWITTGIDPRRTGNIFG